jgi:hypothetical protein
MSQNPDWWIGCKVMSIDPKRISRVQAADSEGVKTGRWRDFTRLEVIDRIDNKKEAFSTVIFKNGQWQRGADVHTVKIDQEKFIRTDRNAKAEDNLENLPDCKV